jgi:LL-H family phage holin
MDKILYAVLQCVLVIVAGLITRYVVPWLKTKLDAEKFKTLEQWVKVAVEAAEQVYCKDCQGNEKKTYVKDALTKHLNSKKINITEEQLNILIEAAVKEMNLAIKDKKKQQATSLTVIKKVTTPQKQITTAKNLIPEDTTTTNSEDSTKTNSEDITKTN